MSGPNHKPAAWGGSRGASGGGNDASSRVGDGVKRQPNGVERGGSSMGARKQHSAGGQRAGKPDSYQEEVISPSEIRGGPARPHRELRALCNASLAACAVLAADTLPKRRKTFPNLSCWHACGARPRANAGAPPRQCGVASALALSAGDTARRRRLLFCRSARI